MKYFLRNAVTAPLSQNSRREYGHDTFMRIENR